MGRVCPRCSFYVGRESMAVTVESSPGIWMPGVFPSALSGFPGVISFVEMPAFNGQSWISQGSNKPPGLMNIPPISLHGSSVLTTVISEADWLVDGLLGTGLSRPVDGRLRSVIELINGSGKPILALDLPSGLDADTGQPLGIAVHATATATFVAAKLGFGTAGTTDYTGEVAVIDIGLPGCLLKRFRNV